MTRADLAAAVESYLASLASERHLAPLSIKHYRRDLERLVECVAGEPRAPGWDALEDHHIRRYAGQLHARGLGPRSVARLLSAWRTFFAWLAHKGEVRANPVASVRPPRTPKRLPKALSESDAVALVAGACDGGGAGPEAKATTASWVDLRDHALYELLYSSGLRLSELTSLDRAYAKTRAYESQSWLDLAQAEVTVLGKGGKRRSVPVGAPARAALAAWLDRRDEVAGADPHALFISERGVRLSNRTVQARLKRHAALLGLKSQVHPHVLRHSFASHLLQSSGDLRAVQELLGHASIASTQVYTGLDFQHLAAVYDQAHPRAKKRS